MSKGSKQRPMQIPAREFGERWERVFGGKKAGRKQPQRKTVDFAGLADYKDGI